MKYTALLLLPDYITSNFGQETYQAWVEADTPAQAVDLAQQEAASDDMCSMPYDYFLLALYEGHLTDLSGGIP